MNFFEWLGMWHGYGFYFLMEFFLSDWIESSLNSKERTLQTRLDRMKDGDDRKKRTRAMKMLWYKDFGLFEIFKSAA